MKTDQKLAKQHHNITVTASPKPPFDLMGKIKLQLHTFLPMMSWKCMLTAWSTDCSASKVINPKPSQRPRVNQGSGGGEGLWQHRMKNSIGLQQSEDLSRPSKRLLGFGWCRTLRQQHKPRLNLKRPQETVCMVLNAVTDLFFMLSKGFIL